MLLLLYYPLLFWGGGGEGVLVHIHRHLHWCDILRSDFLLAGHFLPRLLRKHLRRPQPGLLLHTLLFASILLKKQGRHIRNPTTYIFNVSASPQTATAHLQLLLITVVNISSLRSTKCYGVCIPPKCSTFTL